jgi:hypothetical protein
LDTGDDTGIQGALDLSEANPDHREKIGMMMYYMIACALISAIVCNC